MPGNNLLSQEVALLVSLAREGLTSVFGMGTGGSLLLSSPDKLANSQLREEDRLPYKEDTRLNVAIQFCILHFQFPITYRLPENYIEIRRNMFLVIKRVRLFGARSFQEILLAFAKSVSIRTKPSAY